jgi:hypothetical protein
MRSFQPTLPPSPLTLVLRVTPSLSSKVRDLLLSRDAAERELASERSFNQELNRILNSLREEQQQQHLQHHQRLLQQRSALGLGTAAAAAAGLSGSSGSGPGRPRTGSPRG